MAWQKGQGLVAPFTVPNGLHKEMSVVARSESRNISELTKEALRRYIAEFKITHPDKVARLKAMEANV